MLTKELCRRCGAEIPEGALACMICGTPVHAADTPAPTPASAYAPYPGTQPAPGVWAPPNGQPAPTGPSGWPSYPGYSPYPGGVAYPQPWATGYAPIPYGGYYPAPQPGRAPGEVYALVISWIVTVASAVAVLGGLLVTLIGSLAATGGQADDLSFYGSILGFALGPILGGALGLWYGVTGIMRKSSIRFKLPTAWILLALTLTAIGGGFALWQFDFSATRSPGTALGLLPLVTLAGALPALTVLAYASQRLNDPSTRRHLWMSLFYGMTLAPLAAIILELILSVIIARVLNLTPQETQSVLGQPNTGDTSPKVVLAMLLVLSVVAPLVEEGLKPLGALLAIRRLRTPGEAFLVGLAAGVGFDILETLGYIGQGQADWITIAIERIGAGLLHGIGAGMGALGWYYLINGSGVRLRWLKGIGCGVYAIVQHGLFNALSLVGEVAPHSVSQWLNTPFFIGNLPLQNFDFIFMGLYLLLVGVLTLVTGRLLHAKGMPELKPPMPFPPYGPQYPYNPYAAYTPYMPYPYYGQPAPSGWPAPVPPQAAPQPMGGTL